jgi:hypothetical protein
MALRKQLLMTLTTRKPMSGGYEGRQILTGKSYRTGICSDIGKMGATSLILWRILWEPKPLITAGIAKERHTSLEDFYSTLSRHMVMAIFRGLVVRVPGYRSILSEK